MAPINSLSTFTVFFLILLAGSACTELSEYENQQVQEALSDSLLSVTHSTNVQMEVIEDGLLRMRMRNSKSTSIRDSKEQVTRISGPVFIEVFGERGQLETEVQSDSAVHHPQRAEFELFGSVYVRTTDEKQLRSDYLKWERNEDQVSTPGQVTIVTPTDSINARGFRGNTDLSNYTLREVTGQTIIN